MHKNSGVGDPLIPNYSSMKFLKKSVQWKILNLRHSTQKNILLNEGITTHIFLFLRLSNVRIFPLAAIQVKKPTLEGAFTFQILYPMCNPFILLKRLSC